MSPKSAKHAPTKPSARHNVPIVNVFDEDSQAPVQPARRPVVVEIEDVESTPPTQPSNLGLPPVQPMYPSAPVQPMEQSDTQVQNISPFPPIQPMNESPQAPIQQAPMGVPSVPTYTQTPYQAVVPEQRPMTGMSQEPVLPSFFEQDLKHDTAPAGMPVMPSITLTQPVQPNQQTVISSVEANIPQAVVGEINEISESGDGNKKMIGIVLMVIAVIILAIAGLFLYARNLFSPVAIPTPTPTPVATARPTIPPTATPSASDSGKLSSASAELKKKVKVDVLNGTKVAGLAAKQATVLKTSGYTTGTVGNGKPENAGTIVVAPTYKVLAEDIVKLLKDFTFTIKEDAKMTSIQVTLGEQKE